MPSPFHHRPMPNTRHLACTPNRKPNASRVNETQGETKISNTPSAQRTRTCNWINGNWFGLSPMSLLNIRTNEINTRLSTNTNIMMIVSLSPSYLWTKNSATTASKQPTQISFGFISTCQWKIIIDVNFPWRLRAQQMAIRRHRRWQRRSVLFVEWQRKSEKEKWKKYKRSVEFRSNEEKCVRKIRKYFSTHAANQHSQTRKTLVRVSCLRLQCVPYHLIAPVELLRVQMRISRARST